MALTLPASLTRDTSGVVHKTPDKEVQSRIELIFATFLRVRSASQVLRVFNDQALLIPRRGPFGDVVWKKPTISAILSILKHPAYAGALVYRRTRSIRSGVPPGKTAIKRLPLEAWRIRVNDKYPAYLTWETYEQLRDMLSNNRAE